MNLININSFFLLGAVVGVVFSRTLIHSLIWLSVFSLLLTFQYVLFHAIDVAITEAALGTGLSSLVFLTALKKTSPNQRKKLKQKEHSTHD